MKYYSHLRFFVYIYIYIYIYTVNLEKVVHAKYINRKICLTRDSLPFLEIEF